MATIGTKNWKHSKRDTIAFAMYWLESNFIENPQTDYEKALNESRHMKYDVLKSMLKKVMASAES